MRDAAPPLARDNLVTRASLLFRGRKYAKGEAFDAADVSERKLRNMVRARRLGQGPEEKAPAAAKAKAESKRKG